MAVSETVAATRRRRPRPRRAPSRRRRGRDAAYWLYLLPGAVLFLAGHRRAAGRHALPVADQVVRRRRPPSGSAWTTTSELLHDDVFWASFRNTVCDDRRDGGGAHGARAAARRGAVRLHRQAVRAPHAPPRCGPPSTCRRCCRSRWPASSGAGSCAPDGALNSLLDAVGLGALRHDWLGDPDTALPAVMAVMVWVQIGYPVVVFMAALQRVDPELYEAAELDGADWWHRFRHDHPAADPAGDLRGGPDLHHRRAQGVRADLRADPGRPGQRHQRARRTSPTTRSSRRPQVGYGAAISTVLTLIIVVVAVVFIWIQARSERRDRGF